MSAKIAVIDDNREFVEMVQALLDAEGYLVVPIVESLKAHGIVRRERPDLIMLDIRMPGQSGWELLDKLQLDPETKDIPILIATAAVVSMRAEARQLRDRGLEIIAKPFNTQDLLAKVASMLASRRQR